MPYSSDPATAPLIEPRPPMITTMSELSSHCPSAPGADAGERRPHRPAHAGEEGADEERDAEHDGRC